MTLSPSFNGGVIVRGKVVHGFGRGSKTLGFPTANLESQDARSFANTYPTGIYAGWARVMDSVDSAVYPAAISVGWNPTFKDVKEKVFECHILHEYEADFYDKELAVGVCAYIRDELAFTTLEALIAAITNDCKVAREILASDKHFVDVGTKLELLY